MEKSKLLSNEPLQVLTNHIQDLRKIIKTEQGKNKALKNNIIQLKLILSRTSSSKNDSEANSFIETSSLNSSYQINIEAHKPVPILCYSLARIFRKNLKKSFEILKKNPNENMRNFKSFFLAMELSKIVRKCQRNVIDIVRRRVAEKRKRSENVLKGIEKLGGILGKILGLTVKKSSRCGKIGKGLKMFERKVIGMVLEKKRCLVERVKGFYESLLIIEQGLQSLVELLWPKIKKTTRICMGAFRNCKKKAVKIGKIDLKIPLFCLNVTIKALMKKTICTAFFSVLAFSEKSQSKEINISTSHTQEIFQKTLTLSINHQKASVLLSKTHHHLSESLLTLSHLPAKVQNNCTKAAFLQIVTYVTQSIGHNSILQDSLQKLSQTFKLFLSKKSQKSFYIWKAFPCNSQSSKLTKFAKKLSNLLKPSQKLLISKLKQSSLQARKSLTNMKIIIDQQSISRKSQYFLKWQNNFFLQIKENLQVSPSKPNISTPFLPHKPLQVLSYN